MERLTLNAWKVATFTYHLLVKFSTEYGIGEAHRDQIEAHECCIAMLEMDDHLQALDIEEWQVIVELMEALEEISLDDNRLDQITHIGMQANPVIRKDLILFLRNNLDVFAWSH